MKVFERRNYFSLYKDRQELNFGLYLYCIQAFGCIVLGGVAFCIVFNDNIVDLGWNEDTLKYFLAVITVLTFLFYLPSVHWLMASVNKKIIRHIEFLDNHEIELTLGFKKKIRLRNYEIIEDYDTYLESCHFMHFKGEGAKSACWLDHEGVPYTIRDLDNNKFYLFMTEPES